MAFTSGIIKNSKQTSAKEKITEEDIKKIEEAGAEFIKQAALCKENGGDIKEPFFRYNRFIEDGYFNSKTPDVIVLRHQWRNDVCIPLGFIAHSFKNKPESIDIKMLSKYVSRTGNLFEIHRLFHRNDARPDEISVKKTFEIALDKARETANNRKIIVQNAELLDGLEAQDFQFDNYVVFSELLSNAIKYSPDNSEIKVTFSKEDFYLKLPTETCCVDSYYFTVEDRGIGILPEEQKNIFEFGKRGSNVDNIQGTGQGLNDVYKSASRRCHVEITSPLYPDEPKYKGTKIKAALKVDC